MNFFVLSVCDVLISETTEPISMKLGTLTEGVMYSAPDKFREDPLNRNPSGAG